MAMPSKIEIDTLTEVELQDLRNRIADRLQFLHQAGAQVRMREFSVGDRIAFKPHDHDILFGILVRYNKRTVTVITEHGQRWNVVPDRLCRMKDVESSAELLLSNNSSPTIF
jgi:hypothetical protein